MPKYRLGPDVKSKEVLRDRKGRVVNDRYVDEAVEDAMRKARGRPSLSVGGESPLLRVRIPQELDDAVKKAAKHTGKSRADWVREVLTRASRRAAG